jgi:hypothetical protein
MEKSWGCGETPLPRRVGLLMTRERDDCGIIPIISYFGFHRWHWSKLQRGNHMKVGERGTNRCIAKLMPTTPRGFFYFLMKSDQACFSLKKRTRMFSWTTSLFTWYLIFLLQIVIHHDYCITYDFKKEHACFHEPHVSLHDTWFLFYKLLYVTTIVLCNDSLLVKY